MFIYCLVSHFIRQCIYNHIILGNEAKQPTILTSYGVVVHINRYVLQYWSSKADIRVRQKHIVQQSNYKQILSQLNHIYLNYSMDLISIPLLNLHQWKLTKSCFDDLRIILENSSQLKLLYIYLDMNMLNISFILPLNQLIRLNLEIKNQRISKDQIEQLLSSLIYLKHLELKANILENVVNDYF
ncbi:unnamed protein product [Adineta steineri]|uniref:Uncharacterized protein n=1 Tax=Adineta steineri TaxID=433720 RepID=A0A816B7H2_9BILA|nr:unnamed protein product [Adineta steineri]CAF1607214.1 unnamed protein product [Adineta steineri]